ncbi:hypothetical protein ACROYT_G001165 [Oculina patagonica]
MGCFGSVRESLLLAILCSVVCNEVICAKINSRAVEYEEPVLPENTIRIKMPGTRPVKMDTYLCTAVQLPPQKQYLVQFEPSASQETAHHMLLYGCSLPGALLSSWDCKSGPYTECEGSQSILYAWAKDAPAKFLPKDVGFAVGGDSGINYLVLQVHYAVVDTFKAGAKDYSGFILHTSQHSLPYGGGIYLLWAYSGSIPPETAGIHVDMACKYNKAEPMFAFAYRTHAHKLAKVITGYRIRNGIWTMLGKGDPQAPQAFYPMEKTYEIKKGDTLVARCTYDSRGHNIHKTVHMGSSGHDEMCNFYIMYYSNANLLEYSGGDCGEQNHPEIFINFPMPQLYIPRKALWVPLKNNAARRLLVMKCRLIQEVNISDLEYGEEESPRSSSSSDQDKQIPADKNPAPTEIVSQGVSKELVPPTKESQPVIPAVPATSEPFSPVMPSTDAEEHMPELRVVSNWPSLTEKETAKLGQVTGVSLDSKGQVVVFQRGSRTWDANTFDSSDVFRDADTVGTIKEHTVWIMDSVTGKVKGFWGKDMFYLPHGLTIDHEDNLWLTDVGSHQVFKFSPLGSSTQRLLVLGDKLVPGSGSTRFCKPTSVAVDRNGEFYVADGYCNSRILKFSAAGKLLSSWGQWSGQGTPAPGTFFIPHSLALDQTNHTLYVADRENGRVQSFNSITGAFVDEIKLPEFGGVVYAVTYSQTKQGGVLYVVNGPNMDRYLYVPIQGFTIRIADKTVLQTWPSDKEALTQPHDVVSSADGSDVYVVEISPNRVWKLSSNPQINAVTTPMNAVPVITSDQVINQDSHSIHDKPQQQENTPTVQAFAMNQDSHSIHDKPQQQENTPTVQAFAMNQDSHSIHDKPQQQENTPTVQAFAMNQDSHSIHDKPQQQENTPTVQAFAMNQDSHSIHDKPQQQENTPTVQAFAMNQDSHSIHDKPQQQENTPTVQAFAMNQDSHSIHDKPQQQENTPTVQAFATQGSEEKNENKAVPDTSKPHTNSSVYQASTRLGQINDTGSLKPLTQSSVMWVNVTDQSRFISNPTATHTGKNSSISGPQDDALGGDDNITAGVIPALIILSVLAVPIVFLLLISITLRLRAYHRDKRSQMNGFHGNRKDLTVGRSRGWWSYMNCCDRRKYKFNRVTLQDFYSDSDSDGV